MKINITSTPHLLIVNPFKKWEQVNFEEYYKLLQILKFPIYPGDLIHDERTNYLPGDTRGLIPVREVIKCHQTSRFYYKTDDNHFKQYTDETAYQFKFAASDIFELTKPISIGDRIIYKLKGEEIAYLNSYQLAQIVIPGTASIIKKV